MYFEEVNKDEALQTIIKTIEEKQSSRMKRIIRSATHDGKFYLTMVLENYEIVEIELTASRFGHMTALECEVEVY
jgi:hypothetical protein